MSHLPSVMSLIPAWVLPWLTVAAIAAWILRARRVAITLSVALFAHEILAPAVRPWLMQLPLWVLALAGALVALVTLQKVLTLVFGRGAAAYFVGIWLVRIGDLLLLGPLRVVGRLLRYLLTGN